MDYFTPLAERRHSFKEFVEEWITGQFRAELARRGLALPWYWDEFTRSIDYYHHMVYASAYTYRASVWFDCVLPGPSERAWLAEKYPASWPEFEPIWRQVTERTRQAGPGVEWFTHGTTPVTFCDLCQLVLCGGTPRRNTAVCREHGGKQRIFCSEPCAVLFEQEPARYEAHESVVQRIASGKAPGNLLALLRTYFGLSQDHWGKDVARGDYDWLAGEPATPASAGEGPLSC
jgi:toluene monooxygenase system protein A